MLRPLASALVVAAFAAVLPSQQAITSHPQDSPLDGTGNIAPFGVLPPGYVAEAHVQILIPKDELPAQGALLEGLEAAGLIGGTVHYAELRITAMPVSLVALSTTFAANLVGPATVVLNATATQVTWATADWTPLLFSTPYVHDGASALLLDIRKIVAPTPSPSGGGGGGGSGGGGSGGGGGGGSGGTAPAYPYVGMTTPFPARLDRPRMVYVFGEPGTGAADLPLAFAAEEPISLRLRWSGAPTFRHRSDTTLVHEAYGLGNTLDLAVEGAPNAVYATMLADSFLPAPIALPGIAGVVRLAALNLFQSGFLDAFGHGGAQILIPNDPTLVGAHIVWQGITLDLASGTLALTNGSDHFVQP